MLLHIRTLQYDALNHDDDLESVHRGAQELMAPVRPVSAVKHEHQGISLQFHH